MFKLRKYLFILVAILFQLKSYVFGINASHITHRSSDGLFTGSSNIDRQFPGETFLVPQMVLGVLLPIAIIIGIGIILMKIFIIGFLLLGRAGYGGYGSIAPGGGYGGVSPWRVDGHQPTSRSLLDKDGTIIPPFLSSTVFNLMQKVSSALEKFEKNKMH